MSVGSIPAADAKYEELYAPARSTHSVLLYVSSLANLVCARVYGEALRRYRIVANTTGFRPVNVGSIPSTVTREETL